MLLPDPDDELSRGLPVEPLPTTRAADRTAYSDALLRAEAATDKLRGIAPQIAEALQAWADVVLHLVSHDIANVQTVLRGEQDLAREREARYERLLTRLDTIAERLERGDQRFDVIDRAIGLGRPDGDIPQG